MRTVRSTSPSETAMTVSTSLRLRLQAQAVVMSCLNAFWIPGCLALLVAPIVLPLPRVGKSAALGH